MTGEVQEMTGIERDVVTLIEEQRWAALATVTDDGPLASMVAYAVEPKLGGLLIFVSQLAAHTRSLLQSPRCSFVISAPDLGNGDPQLLPRVSLRGLATPVARDDDEFSMAAARYARRFPDALPRFELGDFHLLRFVIHDARYVGGFARAASFTGEQLHLASQLLEERKGV